MVVHSYYLNVSEFENDYSALYSWNDGMENVIEKIHAVHCSIPDFLRSLDDIEDLDIQMNCRTVAIAQMYCVNYDYQSGYPFICSAPSNNDIFLLECEGSTVAVSKYGEILLPTCPTAEDL